MIPQHISVASVVSGLSCEMLQLPRSLMTESGGALTMVIPRSLRLMLEAQTTTEEHSILACFQTQGQLPFLYSLGLLA